MNSNGSRSRCSGREGAAFAGIRSWRLFLVFTLSLPFGETMADNSYHDLVSGIFSQDWSNARMITASDDWSGVPSIVGYRGDGLANAAGVDPRTILSEGTDTPVDVNANQVNPNTYTSGGVTEFDGIADRTVALQGSTTARAPFLLLHIRSTSMMQVRVRYDLRDIDGSADNAVQPVALHYRIGETGRFVNVPAAYVADASTGPNLATNVTRVDVVLPADADDQPRLQIRIMTADAVGSDEWTGVDNIVVGATPITAVTPPAPKEDGTCSIGCATRVGWSYQLQRSTNLADWVDVGAALAGDGATHEFRDAVADGCAFWRVEVRGL